MNWKQEAIEHLQKYDAMVQAMENIPTELARLEQASCGIGGVTTDSPRVKKSTSPGNDRLINNLVQRQELTRSYENARLWVDATDKALSVLAPEEKQILLRMYVRPVRGAVSELCTSLGLEQSSVYRRRDNALYRFTLALYGAA